MEKHLLADAGTNVSRRYPQMIQLRFFFPDDKRVEAEQLTVVVGNVDLIRGDEIRRNREVVLPVSKPMFGIAPMPFGIMGDTREGGGVFSCCFSYFQRLPC